MNIKDEWTDIKKAGVWTWFKQAPMNVKIAAITAVVTVIALVWVAVAAVV